MKSRRKKTGKKLAAILMALLLAGLCACAPQPPKAPEENQSAGQTSPVSQPEPDGPRAITRPSDLLGEPDEIVLCSQGREPALNMDSPGTKALLDTLAQRFPEKLAAAAQAFEWNREDGQGIDWPKMAEDFDYIRLSYDQEQSVILQCLAAPEGLPPREETVTFTEIIFPLNGGMEETCILDRGTYGVLEHSQKTLIQLRNYFPLPAPGLESMVAAYPREISFPGERVQNIAPIRGDEEGFLAITKVDEDTLRLYYCDGAAGETTLLCENLPSAWFDAGRLPDGTLQAVMETGETICRWKDGKETRETTELAYNGLSCSYPRGTFYWWSDEGLCYGSQAGRAEGLLPKRQDIDPSHQEGYYVHVKFSPSGRLAIVCETSYYDQRLGLLDLDTNEYRPMGDWHSDPGLNTQFVGETAVVFHGDGAQIELWTMEGGRELTLDPAAGTYTSGCGPNAVYREAGESEIYRVDIATGKENPVFRSDNPNIWLRTALEGKNYEALVLVEVSERNPTALVIRPR